MITAPRLPSLGSSMVTPRCPGSAASAPLRSRSMTGSAWSLAMAKRMFSAALPAPLEATAVLTPMTSPTVLTNGPPELPERSRSSFLLQQVSPVTL